MAGRDFGPETVTRGPIWYWHWLIPLALPHLRGIFDHCLTLALDGCYEAMNKGFPPFVQTVFAESGRCDHPKSMRQPATRDLALFAADRRRRHADYRADRPGSATRRRPTTRTKMTRKSIISCSPIQPNHEQRDRFCGRRRSRAERRGRRRRRRRGFERRSLRGLAPSRGSQ